VSVGGTIFSASLGPSTTFLTTGPAGTYYTRVRAANPCGVSAPSVELPITLGCSSMAIVPANLAVTKVGGIATFSWLPPLGATSFRLQAGTSAGSSNAADTDVGAVTSLAIGLGGVPPGTYYVRVAAVSACGVGGPSNEVVVTVP
jgi:hypothetical protein